MHVTLGFTQILSDLITDDCFPRAHLWVVASLLLVIWASLSQIGLLVTCWGSGLGKVQALRADWPCTSSLIGSCQHASRPLCREISSDFFHSCKLCTFEDLGVLEVPKHPQQRSRGPKHVSCRSFCWLLKVTQPSELSLSAKSGRWLSVIYYRCYGRCSFDWYIRDKT